MNTTNNNFIYIVPFLRLWPFTDRRFSPIVFLTTKCDARHAVKVACLLTPAEFCRNPGNHTDILLRFRKKQTSSRDWQESHRDCLQDLADNGKI